MTLILTALYKNGVCTCADKRIVTRDKNGLKQYDDNHNKIYKFKDIPLIIFNHGINKFNNKSWRTLCSEYENSNQWKNNNLIRIADNFKDFIEDDVRNGLINNKKFLSYTDFFNSTGFVLFGETSKDNKFKVKEFFWTLNFNEDFYCHTRRHKGGLIRSGVGLKYLEKYLNNSEGKELNTISYWKKLNFIQAKIELEKLFNIAIAEKKQNGGDEFSDNFDFDNIMD